MSQHLEHEAAKESATKAFYTRHFVEIAPPLPEKLDLNGKTAVVTGSNVGLGLECAKHLLSHNLTHLILAVRSQSKGDAAAAELRQQNRKAQIEVWLLDMASYQSITDFVQRCKTTLPRLDIAILNAGLAVANFQRIGEKQREVSLQINFLSTVFLATQLLPLLKSTPERSEPGRITMVGSDTTYHASDNLRDPFVKPLIAAYDDPATYTDGFHQYVMAKFYQLVYVAKLADEVSSDDVIVNIAMPGLCKGTQFARKPDGKWYMRLLLSLFGKEPSRGANVIVNAAVVQGKESHGSLVSEAIIKP